MIAIDLLDATLRLLGVVWIAVAAVRLCRRILR